MPEQEPPRIRVRLEHVSRSRKEPAWLKNTEHEVHYFSLDIVDNGTRDSAQRGINFETVDSTVRDFIASTWIGDDFDLAFMPVEQAKDNEPKPISKQTDLAESILEWVRLNKEHMQGVSVGMIAKLLETFLIDVENLCHVYLEDGLYTKEEKP